jgi:hypothetical protein
MYITIIEKEEEKSIKIGDTLYSHLVSLYEPNSDQHCRQEKRGWICTCHKGHSSKAHVAHFHNGRVYTVWQNTSATLPSLKPSSPPKPLILPKAFSLKVGNKTFHVYYHQIAGVFFGNLNQSMTVCIIKRASPATFYTGAAGLKEGEANDFSMARRIAFHRAVRNLACEEMRKAELEYFDGANKHVLTNLTNAYYSVFRQAAHKALECHTPTS